MDESKITEEEVTWARRSHLSLFLFYPLFLVLALKGVPLAFVIGMLGTALVPLYIWLTKGRKSRYIAHHAKEATFLQMFMAIVGGGISLLWGGDGTSGKIMEILSYLGASFYHIGATITGSIKSTYKKIFSYPLSIFKGSQPTANSDFEESMNELKSLENLDKVTAEMLKDTLKTGSEKIREIDQLTARIQDASIKQKVQGIREVIVKIFENFKKDPEDIKLSKQFLSYYLDTTIKIIRKYIDLSEQKVISTDLTESLKKVDNLLVSIKEAFETHYSKLLSNDIMDLDVEITVMEKTMKAEGM
jgi:5-bromo-4-chloroindolyl phosphate hydrolysis protein